jgi:hypothetical protein
VLLPKDQEPHEQTFHITASHDQIFHIPATTAGASEENQTAGINLLSISSPSVVIPLSLYFLLTKVKTPETAKSASLAPKASNKNIVLQHIMLATVFHPLHKYLL